MDPRQHRERMVAEDIIARGIRNPTVISAFLEVPREAFVPDVAADLAYEDMPLSIGHGQTISQPYIVALTAEALHLSPEAKVLEIGAGSGYAAAILSRLAREVITVERYEALVRSAKERLLRLGYTNVRVLHGDGWLGAPEYAPYDGIAVAAGGLKVPEPLLSQLAIGGRLVIPVGPHDDGQTLVRITRLGPDVFEEDNLGDVRFVPLIPGTPIHLH
jgi:protein-L-isoaspartate(D-aspartate) O-methyltransferase